MTLISVEVKNEGHSGWKEREKQLVILACYSSPLLMCLGLPLSDKQVAHYAIGGEKPAGRADTPKARVKKREWENAGEWKNESWKENDRVHLNGPVVNALWDWAEEGETGSAAYAVLRHINLEACFPCLCSHLITWALCAPIALP